MLGQKLEASGWRQGSVINRDDLSALFVEMDMEMPDNAEIAIVASQSCDIANNNLYLDPYVEVSIGTFIGEVGGHFAHNKNPRKLHLTLSHRTRDETVISYQNVELKAYERIQIPKHLLCEISLDHDLVLESKVLESYVSWLAARYSRPALPSVFNDRISKADPRGKFKKKAKSVSKFLSGIYIEITPDKEISEDETYQVNILGLTTPEANEKKDELLESLQVFVDVMENAGMDVRLAVSSEDEISIATIKRFNRFYYDDISFKSDEVLPPEVTENL